MNDTTIQETIPVIVGETGERLKIVERKVVPHADDDGQLQSVLKISYFDEAGEPAEKIGTVAAGTKLQFLIHRNGQAMFATSE
jgi:hypothetical protein